MLFAIEEQKDFCNGNLRKIGYKLKKTGFAKTANVGKERSNFAVSYAIGSPRTATHFLTK